MKREVKPEAKQEAEKEAENEAEVTGGTRGSERAEAWEQGRVRATRTQDTSWAVWWGVRPLSGAGTLEANGAA